MISLKKFLKTTLIGGLTTVVPIGIVAGIFHWLFLAITNIIQPMTNMIMAKSNLKEILADGVVILAIIALCFFIGLVIQTNIGRWIHNTLEKNLLDRFPGYSLFKETFLHLLSQEKQPFSQVALAQIFPTKTLVTCFVTAEHSNGWFTVFVPTGPNPTSGNIYHLPPEQVKTIPKANVQTTMQTIIACGAGSEELITKVKPNLN